MSTGLLFFHAQFSLNQSHLRIERSHVLIFCKTWTFEIHSVLWKKNCSLSGKQKLLYRLSWQPFNCLVSVFSLLSFLFPSLTVVNWFRFPLKSHHYMSASPLNNCTPAHLCRFPISQPSGSSTVHKIIQAMQLLLTYFILKYIDWSIHL